MAKRKFREIRMSPANLKRLHTINKIIEEYQAEGYTLTLRQLYYQLVSRDIVPNKQSEYSKLSTLLKEGRMSGIVEWDAIEDRLRQPSVPASFEGPKQILQAAINQYELPRQEGQERYIEVWVEKDALSGVLSRVTEPYHVPILVNRGYSSVSAMYESYKRFKSAILNNQHITILYLGDFDPSGLDMIRDIKNRVLEFILNDKELLDFAFEERMNSDNNSLTEIGDKIFNNFYEIDYSDHPYLFDEDYSNVVDYDKCYLYTLFEIEPIALTRAQIRQYNPPPNPAKREDPRAKDFIKNHGSTSWEVDALRPEILNSILDTAILQRVDIEKYNLIVQREDADKNKLKSLLAHL